MTEHRSQRQLHPQLEAEINDVGGQKAFDSGSCPCPSGQKENCGDCGDPGLMPVMYLWQASIGTLSSPDRSSLDYGIWGFAEGKACVTLQRNMEHLKVKAESLWTNIPEDDVVNVAFRPCVKAMDVAGGSHMNKIFS
ncbi:unnamed protein product [Lepeophtheirus salmonis]|uniref:(salmon louse) hypothetical protein n=1 Tax=Lepeophtheirus salmonis TaxID=72036 RepID=A0A7R8H0N8_LEPSM|nr:unnamed protein product [Lepeophtheirus salmonis]CAF2793097.1 unnamed protein product [Lepeophtheirus salmonis]